MQGEPIILGYWGIRGRGQLPRLLLAYTKIQWKDKKYIDRNEWNGPSKDKVSLNLPFPNLPYLIHDDLKITQSKAIVNYIINISDKKQLFGKDLKDQTVVDCLVAKTIDIFDKIVSLNMNVEQFEQKASTVEKEVEIFLEMLQLTCQGQQQFALGYLTLADFIISEASYYIENVFPEAFDKAPCLKVIRASFEALEWVKEYYAREDSVKAPFLPPVCKINF